MYLSKGLAVFIQIGKCIQCLDQELVYEDPLTEVYSEEFVFWQNQCVDEGLQRH